MTGAADYNLPFPFAILTVATMRMAISSSRTYRPVTTKSRRGRRQGALYDVMTQVRFYRPIFIGSRGVDENGNGSLGRTAELKFNISGKRPEMASAR
jgi:hypothetical protein